MAAMDLEKIDFGKFVRSVASNYHPFFTIAFETAGGSHIEIPIYDSIYAKGVSVRQLADKLLQYGLDVQTITEQVPHPIHNTRHLHCVLHVSNPKTGQIITLVWYDQIPADK